jgi:two-component system, cell cycle sensor histidine kinase and response regulator CckA
LKVLASKVAMESEDIVPQLKGERTFLVTRFPLTDSEGRVYAVGGIATDYTEHKKVQEQLRQAQRMESIGRLAGGVAHDFNNLLTVINGYSAMLLDDLGPGGRGEDDLQQILKAGASAAELTRQLLAFSRRQILDPKVLNLNESVTRVQSILRRLIGEDIALITDLDPELGAVHADPTQFEQVIMNLAVNARDAMPDGGTVTIKSSNVIIAAGEARLSNAVVPGEYVLISVTDTGCGMSEDIKAEIFEPFFTTKAQDKGTGLGLSTVYGIVRQSGGCISVESAPGRGSTFSIYLPRVQHVPAEPEVTLSAETLYGRETILLLEDERGVRQYAERVLRDHGYQVISTDGPAEAIAAIESQAGMVDLVITDVVMPSMNGRQLADRLLELQPDLKILFISGYSNEILAPKGVMPSGINFLPKPFTAQTLTSKVRGLLQSKERQSHVLVIDDDSAVRDALRQFLELEGYTVSELHNGKNAVATCKKQCPDIVVTDLVMPETEGLETIRELKKCFPLLPVIAMSGKFIALLKPAEALGANATFPKPLDLSAVAARIRELLKS